MAKPTFNVREGRVEIDVANDSKKLTYIHPAFGPNDYESLRRQITEAGLKLANMKDYALILFSSFENPEQKYADEPKNIMRNKYFYVFNKTLWIPKGVYIVDDDGKKSLTLEENKLERKLNKEENYIAYSKDGKIRFVPKEHVKLGEQSSLDLAKNRYVIALAGNGEAEMFARVSENYKNKPHVHGLEDVTSPVQMVSGLDSIFNYRLRLGGYYHDYDWVGCAFGVKK